jgi:hypothetical protein
MMDDISSSTATEMENLKTEWGNRFIISAIIQGGIITAIALVTVGVQLFFYQSKYNSIFVFIL